MLCCFGFIQIPSSSGIWDLGLLRNDLAVLDGFPLSFPEIVKLRDRTCMHLVCGSLLFTFGQENGTLIHQYRDGVCCAVVGMALSMFFKVVEWNESYWKDELEKNMLNASQQK